MDSSVSPKDEIWFLRVYHHISNTVYCLRVRLRSKSCFGNTEPAVDDVTLGNLSLSLWLGFKYGNANVSAVLSVLFGLKTTLPYSLYFVNMVDARLWDYFCPYYALRLVQSLLIQSFYVSNARSITFLHYWHALSSGTQCFQPDAHSTTLNNACRGLLEVWKELSAFSSELSCPKMWFTTLVLEIPSYIFNGGLSTRGIHRRNKLSL
jgi:hypothetical protein